MTQNGTIETVPFDFEFDDEFLKGIDLLYSSPPVKKPPESSILSLPAELLENICVFLPIKDICLNLNLVSRRFNNIISDQNFLQYKKLFSMHRSGKLTKELKFYYDFTAFVESSRETCFADLARLREIANFRKSTSLVEKSLHGRIENFVSYSIAKKFIERDFKAPCEEPTFYTYLGGYSIQYLLTLGTYLVMI